MNILIDISNIVPGVGGSGGGIAVYAGNLLNEIDQLEIDTNNNIYCIVNKKNNIKKFRNITVIETSFNTKSFIARFLWLNFYLPIFCIRHKISVLHRVVPELPLFKVCSYICTLHDLMYRFHLSKQTDNEISLKRRLKAMGYGLILKSSLKNATRILVPSHSIKNEIINVLRIPSSKVEVTHEGVKKFNAQRATNEESKIFKIIVVAGFYPHKGHGKVIELVKNLLGRGITNFMITLRGNPFYTSILEFIKNEITRNQLEQFICIEGFKKEHSIEKMYANYDCFLLLSEYEGFGLPVLEAQMSGLPVVCSEIDVFKEVLADSAVFVNTDEIAISCDRVIELMKDNQLRNSLVEKGYENCKRFSWSKMAEETMMVYNRC